MMKTLVRIKELKGQVGSRLSGENQRVQWTGRIKALVRIKRLKGQVG